MSAPWARALAGVAVGALAFALTTPSLAEGRLDAFRRLRAEGLAAAKAGDMAAAQARISEAVTTLPSHPGAILLLARLKAADDPAGAVALLARHAAMGLIHNAPADPLLKALADRADYAPVAARVAANRQPIGALKPVADFAGPVLAESVAYDSKAGRLLVSQIHARRIVAIGKDGAVSEFTAPSDDIWGVFGIAIDAPRRILWALTAATLQAKGVAAADLDAIALLRIDLDTGKILARYAPPADGTKRQLGDLTVGPDGAVYASNSLGGEVWRLEPGAKALDRLVSSPELGSPQGLALAADGKHLLVADYSSGLHVINLASGAVTPVATPPDVTLLGVDGLTRTGQTLIAVQNGVAPQRLLRLWPTPDGKRLTRVETLAASLPDLDEPTSGAIRGDDFVFVARSQWTDFGDDGLKTAAPGAARVMAIKVTH
ncbi:SMP-30/gluconolactonase/LRE family protein [Caulobacter sp. ErkDOM-YI]|uniref:SMP-30/gluconolactonase/LRE family protein n=1 Tax=unclassified Caulobacter TaxID=2648921 RepID=UPI003AF6CF07